jgi:hypothetical protein
MSHPINKSVLDRVSEGLSAATCEAWVEHRLGERLWSKQREIAKSVRENRLTAVMSCNGVGKSHLASRLLLWWLSTHPVGQAFGLVTAPTQSQLESVVFRYAGQAHAAAELPGRVTGGNVPAIRAASGELIAMGRKPADLADRSMAMAALQGIHAPFPLGIFDEAGGLGRHIFDAMFTLLTNDEGRLLAIGNPDSPASYFKEVCAPGSGWNVIRISFDDSPNFTGEEVAPELAKALIDKKWIAEREADWGRGSALWTSKVEGLFPEVSEDTLIGADLIVRAQQRELSDDEALHAHTVLSGDVARLGGDRTAVYRNRAGHIRLIKQTIPQETMRTAGDFAALKAEPQYFDTPFVLDVGGLGIGIYDRLVEQGVSVLPFNGAERAWRPDRFANRRAEVFWELREAMMRDQIDLDPLDQELAAQLSGLRWQHDSKARIVIESKATMRGRGLPSPDRADAVAMSFATGSWKPSPLSPEQTELRELVARVERAEERRATAEREGRADAAPMTDNELLRTPL